jgi:hypothetical protein
LTISVTPLCNGCHRVDYTDSHINDLSRISTETPLRQNGPKKTTKQHTSKNASKGDQADSCGTHRCGVYMAAFPLNSCQFC